MTEIIPDDTMHKMTDDGADHLS